MLSFICLVALVLVVAYRHMCRSRELDHIPTIGYSDPLLGYLTAIRYIFDAKGLVNEGYEKYPNGAVKIRTINGWSIVINGTQYIKEIQRAAQPQLDASSPISNFFQFDHTLALVQRDGGWHHTVLQTTFTRNIRERFDDIHGEVVRACEDIVGHSGVEWVTISAWDATLDVITKVTAQYYLGSPLSKNAEFLAIMRKAGPELFKGAILRYLPPLLRQLCAKLITDVHGLRKRMEVLIGPIIRERLARMEAHGTSCAEDSNDLISWLIDDCLSAGQVVLVEDMASRMIFLEFASLFTMVSSTTFALHDLSFCPPSDVEELKNEIKEVTSGGEWSKDCLERMVKLDSFFRESQRLHSLHIMVSPRTTLRDDFTFSDGFCIPKGATLAINTCNRHLDTDVYGPSPEVFDAFRFVDKANQHRVSRSTSPDPYYLPFGIGRAACPGRFFASTTIKLILAQVIMQYGIAPTSREYPASIQFEAVVRTNPKATVMIRKIEEK